MSDTTNSTSSMAQPDLNLELVSNPLYLCGVRQMISQVSRRLGFSDAHCSQIALAVDEALANVMRHGYDKRLDGRIWVKLTPLVAGPEGGAGVAIVIEDEARQVEPQEIKGRDLEDVRPGGLGVHIIKEVMDQAVYEKRNGAGMRLTMIKRQVVGKDAGAESAPACGMGSTGCGCGEGGEGKGVDGTTAGGGSLKS